MKKIQSHLFSIAGIALVIMLVMDFIWIGFVAKNFYISKMGSYYSPHPVIYAAVIFYVLYILGVSYFVITPAVREKSLLKALLGGAFFALVAFATYVMTALSVITNWPPILSFVDMSWGTFEGGVVSLLTYLIAVKAFRW
jgi:uncharacterized membrane protein